LYGGGDLIDYLEERVYLPEGKVQVFMNKLLSCMEYLHDSRRMVHRDLKLENILLDTDQDLQVSIPCSVKRAIQWHFNLLPRLVSVIETGYEID
jgi:serine/threonine protein kinase